MFAPRTFRQRLAKLPVEADGLDARDPVGHRRTSDCPAAKRLAAEPRACRVESGG